MRSGRGMKCREGIRVRGMDDREAHWRKWWTEIPGLNREIPDDDEMVERWKSAQEKQEEKQEAQENMQEFLETLFHRISMRNDSKG